MHPHEINGLALRASCWTPGCGTVLEALLGEEVLAAQSMFYFKPPGARGQALHQDNFYLRVEPGTCVAAWVACDVIDRDNGGLEVVPGHAPDGRVLPGAGGLRGVVRPGVRAAAAGARRRCRSTWRRGTSCSSTGAWCTARSRTARPTGSAGRSSGTTWGASTERIGHYYRTLSMSGARVPLPESEGAGPCGTEFAPHGPH